MRVGVRLPAVVVMADGVVAALKCGHTGPVIALIEDSPVAEATKTPRHAVHATGVSSPGSSRRQERRLHHTHQDFDEALSTATATRICWINAVDSPDASFS